MWSEFSILIYLDSPGDQEREAWASWWCWRVGVGVGSAVWGLCVEGAGGSVRPLLMVATLLASIMAIVVGTVALFTRYGGEQEWAPLRIRTSVFSFAVVSRAEILFMILLPQAALAGEAARVPHPRPGHGRRRRGRGRGGRLAGPECPQRRYRSLKDSADCDWSDE